MAGDKLNPFTIQRAQVELDRIQTEWRTKFGNECPMAILCWPGGVQLPAILQTPFHPSVLVQALGALWGGMEAERQQRGQEFGP